MNSLSFSITNILKTSLDLLSILSENQHVITVCRSVIANHILQCLAINDNLIDVLSKSYDDSYPFYDSMIGLYALNGYLFSLAIAAVDFRDTVRSEISLEKNLHFLTPYDINQNEIKVDEFLPLDDKHAINSLNNLSRFAYLEIIFGFSVGNENDYTLNLLTELFKCSQIFSMKLQYEQITPDIDMVKFSL